MVRDANHAIGFCSATGFCYLGFHVQITSEKLKLLMLHAHIKSNKEPALPPSTRASRTSNSEVSLWRLANF